MKNQLKKDLSKKWKMALNMKENGLKAKISDREKEDKFGLMGLYMKDGGKITKLMEMEG